MRKMLVLTGLLVVALSCAPLLAAHAGELEDIHTLSMEFETPHTDWAQPYAQGAVRVLFFSDGRGTSPRHIIELMQRFDIRAEAAYFKQIIDSPQFHWAGDQAGL